MLWLGECQAHSHVTLPTLLPQPALHRRRMCGSLCMRPARTESGIQRRIAALILLHEAMAVLPPLAEALQGARCELLQVWGGTRGKGDGYRRITWSSSHVGPPHVACVRCLCPQAVGAACGHAAFGELQQLLQSSLEEDVQSNKNTFLNRWMAQACGSGLIGDWAG